MWLYNNLILDLFTHVTMILIFNFKHSRVFSSKLTNQYSRNRHSLTVEVPLIPIRKPENEWTSKSFSAGVLDFSTGVQDNTRWDAYPSGPEPPPPPQTPWALATNTFLFSKPTFFQQIFGYMK